MTGGSETDASTRDSISSCDKGRIVEDVVVDVVVVVMVIGDVIIAVVERAGGDERVLVIGDDDAWGGEAGGGVRGSAESVDRRARACWRLEVGICFGKGIGIGTIM